MIMPFRPGQFISSGIQSVYTIYRTILCGLIFSAILLSGSGCVDPAQDGESHVVEFKIQQPEWITRSGREGVPGQIKNLPVKNVVCKYGSVWYGVDGYGLAEYRPDSGKWKLYPLSYSREPVRIVDIAKTENSYFAGTAGLGLFRYSRDTSEWERVSIPGESGSNEIVGIEHTGNTLWIATYGGLFKYNVRAGTFDRVIDEMILKIEEINGKILGIMEMESGLAYLFECVQGKNNTGYEHITKSDDVHGYNFHAGAGTVLLRHRHGFIVIDRVEGTQEVFTVPDSFPSFVATSIIKYRKNYIASSHSGLVIYDCEAATWRLLAKGSGLYSDMLPGIDTDGENIYVASRKGPFIITPEMFEQMLVLSSEISMEDGNSNGTTQVTSDQEATASWKSISFPEGLRNKRIYAIEPDGGAAWIGTEVAGISKVNIDDLSVQNFIYRNDQDNIIGFCPIQEIDVRGSSVFIGGHLFFAEFDSAKNKWVRIERDAELLFDRPIEALWTGRDEVWFSVKKHGITVLNRKNGKWKHYRADPITLTDVITDIVPMRNDLWISTVYGLRKYDRDKDRFRVQKTDIWNIESIVPEGNSLWIGAWERVMPADVNSAGLFKYNVFTRHKVAFNRLPAAGKIQVHDVFVDGPNIWMANGEGLSRYNRLSGRWDNYGTDENLDSENATTIAVAGDTLLLGSMNGLFSRKTILFEEDSDRRLYIRAWTEEFNGNYHDAAVKYNRLLKQISGSNKANIEYRLARCLQLCGRPVAAMEHYESLLHEYPILLLSLDELYTSLYGFDTYIMKIEELKEKYPDNTDIQALCLAHLEFADTSLQRMASIRRRQGRLERAERIWRFIASQTEDRALKKKAETNLLKLAEEQQN